MTGRLAHIYRHPIKGHGREALASVRLSTGACLPFDRHWAVAHEAARLEPGWNPCVNFARGAKAPELMAIASSGFSKSMPTRKTWLCGTNLPCGDEGLTASGPPARVV